MSDFVVLEMCKVIKQQREELSALENTLKQEQYIRQNAETKIEKLSTEIFQKEEFILELESKKEDIEDKAIQEGLKKYGKKRKRRIL